LIEDGSINPIEIPETSSFASHPGVHDATNCQ